MCLLRCFLRKVHLQKAEEDHEELLRGPLFAVVIHYYRLVAVLISISDLSFPFEEQQLSVGEYGPAYLQHE